MSPTMSLQSKPTDETVVALNEIRDQIIELNTNLLKVIDSCGEKNVLNVSLVPCDVNIHQDVHG